MNCVHLFICLCSNICFYNKTFLKRTFRNWTSWKNGPNSILHITTPRNWNDNFNSDDDNMKATFLFHSFVVTNYNSFFCNIVFFRLRANLTASTILSQVNILSSGSKIIDMKCKNDVTKIMYIYNITDIFVFFLYLCFLFVPIKAIKDKMKENNGISSSFGIF